MSLLDRRPGLLVLVDPSRTPPAEAQRVAREARAAGAAGLLIGSSFDGTRDTQLVARAIRQAVPGFPVALFPVLCAIPRTSGWIAQWQELLLDPEQKIARPRQIYLGQRTRDYVAMEKRDGAAAGQAAGAGGEG